MSGECLGTSGTHIGIWEDRSDLGILSAHSESGEIPPTKTLIAPRVLIQWTTATHQTIHLLALDDSIAERTARLWVLRVEK